MATTAQINISFNGVNGIEIVRLMKSHKVTIHQLAKRMDVTLAAVRRARSSHGVSFLAFLDYWQAITQSPELSPRLRAMLDNWRRMKAS